MGKKLRNQREPVYVPSPEEIASKCYDIRMAWTEQELRRRSVENGGSVNVANVSIDEHILEFLAETENW